MSAKNLDRHNRWRSKTVAFRMSPEEADQLDTNVRLSGLTKWMYYSISAEGAKVAADCIKELTSAPKG